MRRPVLSLLWMLMTLMLVGLVTAQESDYVTFETRGGFLLDHPDDWMVTHADDTNTVFFSTDEMYGVINMQAVGLYDTPLRVLADLMSDAGDGVRFDAPRLVDLAEQVNAAQVIGSEGFNTHSMIIAAEVRGYGVYVLVNVVNDDLEPYIEPVQNMTISVRRDGDPPPPRVDDTSEPILLGSGNNRFNLDSLTIDAASDTGGYEFAHPPAWDVQMLGGDILFSKQTGDSVFGVLTAVPLGTRFTAQTPIAILQEDNADSTFGQVTPFDLAGLPAARAYQKNAGTRTVKMVAIRQNWIVLMRATANDEVLTSVEPLLRGMLYSIRPMGASLRDAMGFAAHTGFDSALPYAPDAIRNTSYTPPADR